VDWVVFLALMVAMLVVLMLLGIPIAFVFMGLALLGAVIVWGGDEGMRLLTLNIRASVSRFSLLPIVAFTMLGAIMFSSGVGQLLLRTLGKIVGALPGRLSVLAVIFSALFSSMSGSSVATTSLMGTLLLPEMARQGYKNPMSIGPILGAGGLAILIPPSSLAILVGALGQVSVAAMLIGAAVPGVMLAILYLGYILVRARLQPHLAPVLKVEHYPVMARVRDFLLYVLPMGLVILIVLGMIFVGAATPTESAVVGIGGAMILARAYGKLNLAVLKDAAAVCLRLSVMLFLILATSITFSQILAFSGVTRGLADFAVNLDVPPIVIIMAIMVVVLIMGALMEVATIVMISVPLFMPVVVSLGFNPIWFGLLLLLNIEMALTTPPFGITLFALKGVAPPETRMKDIYTAAFPFLACDAVVLAILVFFPPVALWLPSLL
jgi:tripartite ATP-independent transporter DctM subunit